MVLDEITAVVKGVLLFGAGAGRQVGGTEKTPVDLFEVHLRVVDPVDDHSIERQTGRWATRV